MRSLKLGFLSANNSRVRTITQTNAKTPESRQISSFLNLEHRFCSAENTFNHLAQVSTDVRVVGTTESNTPVQCLESSGHLSRIRFVFPFTCNISDSESCFHLFLVRRLESWLRRMYLTDLYSSCLHHNRGMMQMRKQWLCRRTCGTWWDLGDDTETSCLLCILLQ